MTSLVRIQIAKWTAALALGLGVLVVGFLLAPPPKAHVALPSSTAARGAQEARDDRVPAAVSAVARDPSSGRAEAPVVDDESTERAISCEPEQSFSVETRVRQVRLLGRDCGPRRARSPSAPSKGSTDDSALDVKVANQTNGFSATAFYPSPGAFSTDYISLEPGENRIEVSRRRPNGAPLRSTVRILRGPDGD